MFGKIIKVSIALGNFILALTFSLSLHLSIYMVVDSLYDTESLSFITTVVNPVAG